MTEKQRTLETFNSDSRTEWVIKELDEVAHINLGQSPKGEYYNEEGDGPHFLQGSKNFGNKYPELERFCSKPKREAEEGDVLISVRAPVGPVNVAPERVCIGRGVTGLRMYEGDNDYLYYFLKYYNEQNRWSQYADGTTFNSITKTDLQNLEIPYPPIEERNKIATVLRNLDNKIEINNRINELLEEIAQTLYRSWFVDFDPYSEFKHSDSELGNIPTGFEVEELSEIAKIVDCLHDKKPDEQEEGRFYIEVNDIGENGELYLDDKYLISEEDYEQWTRRITAKPGDVIISKDGRVGAVAQIPEGIEGAIGRNLVCIRPTSEKLNPTLLKEYMMSPTMRREVGEKTLSRAIFETLHVSEIEDLRVLIPPAEDRKEFEHLVKPMHEKINANLKQNIELAKTRDTLLPKLMSGEIRLDPDSNNEPVNNN